LETDEEMRVIGEAANGREALMLAEYYRPDILVMDVGLLQPSGIAATRRIAAMLKSAGIVFVAAEADPEYVNEAFKAGARGYVLADAAPNELTRAIRVVANGGKFLSRNLSHKGSETRQN
jgi:DNA-binding NarL/FixJ family response regulator